MSASELYAMLLEPSATKTMPLGLNVDEPSSSSPFAMPVQLPPPGEGRVSAIQLSPSMLTAPVVPEPNARNLPVCPIPSKS